MMRVTAWQCLQTLRREHGQDLVEYALLLGAVALVVFAAVSALGSMVQVTFYDRFVDIFGHL